MKVGEIITFTDKYLGKTYTMRYIGSKDYGTRLMFEPVDARIPILFIGKGDFKKTINMKGVKYGKRSIKSCS